MVAKKFSGYRFQVELCQKAGLGLCVIRSLAVVGWQSAQRPRLYLSDHLQWSDDTATKDHVFIHPITCSGRMIQRPKTTFLFIRSLAVVGWHSDQRPRFYSSDHLQWSDDTATKDHVFIHPITCSGRMIQRPKTTFLFIQSLVFIHPITCSGRMIQRPKTKD